MTTRLIFLGPPGAGKGTQAQVLAEELKVPHISTGEILRSAIELATPLGQQTQSYMERGELVPDELMLDLIRNRLNQADAQNGWILDGFPRTVTQASFLEDLLQEIHQTCECAIYLKVPDEVLISRLLARGRQDDNEKTIRRRLDVYHQETEPVIDFYSDRSSLRAINGDCSLPEVTESLKEAIAPC
ncbi:MULTISPECIES: adenylate kinase [unclassified Coleofasciculus]|uniref:adenylate kinase n=1 Tax=unclassified Coleofasciculus TaxID=2692782 RepID=UPI001882E803|nr:MULTISPECIES: adenylate kinase [unclassified Coleofasciculus]MBE9126765.1 adenylate kinase [Coleofasciculus sp. LEGE 07081]MBE9150136.1 adenylate kinase [Coleofasciculus sp. LEGE 07092]